MLTLSLFDLPFLVKLPSTGGIDTTSYVTFASDLFTSVNGPPTVSLYLDRIGYTGSVCSVCLSMSQASAYFSNTPAKGIQANPAPFYFNGGTNPVDAIFSMSWNSTSASRQMVEVYYNSSFMTQTSLMGSCSISTSVGCSIGPISLANARMFEADADTDFFLNVMRFDDTSSFVGNGFINGTSSVSASMKQYFGSVFNGVSHIPVPTTGSYITMDGTAHSGSDYQFKSGEFRFDGGNSGEGKVNTGSVNMEVYPTIAGKYFYIRLYNPIEPESASITYPGTIKIIGSNDIVSFDTSSFNSTVGNNAYFISMSRTGDISQPLDIIVDVITSSNFDPFGYPIYPVISPTQYTPPYTISWGAGDGTLKEMEVTNTLLLDANPGGITMSLSKSLGYENVIFSPSSSIVITYVQP